MRGCGIGGCCIQILIMKDRLGESMGAKAQRRKQTGNGARELLSFPIVALTHVEEPDG